MTAAPVDPRLRRLVEEATAALFREGVRLMRANGGKAPDRIEVVACVPVGDGAAFVDLLGSELIAAGQDAQVVELAPRGPLLPVLVALKAKKGV